MNHDDIIRMAKEAGYIPFQFTSISTFERFAELVVAAEREACAKVCDELEHKKWEVITTGGVLSGFGAIDCAAAIRARGEQ